MANWGLSLARFSVVPAFLLVAAYICCAPPRADSAATHPTTVASKTYADSGSQRARMLRPSRAQIRLPNARKPDGKKGSDDPGGVNVAATGFFLDDLQASAGSPTSDARLTPALLRQHHPRDPPSV
jgi:hypothetical protein